MLTGQFQVFLYNTSIAVRLFVYLFAFPFVPWFCMLDGVITKYKANNFQSFKWVFLFHFFFVFFFFSFSLCFISFSILAILSFEGGVHRACGNSSGAQKCPTNITKFDTFAGSFFFYCISLNSTWFLEKDQAIFDCSLWTVAHFIIHCAHLIHIISIVCIALDIDRSCLQSFEGRTLGTWFVEWFEWG